MGNQATFGIAITADDKTAKGRKSAEQSFGKTAKNLGDASKRTMADADRTVGGSGRNMLRTFASVEKASARAFGGKSLTEGFVKRMGALGDAGAAAGEGLGEASAAGGVLEGTLGAVGVAAAGTVGILAAAAYGAFKLADGWAKGAASIGRTAEIIGVGTKAMQEFTLAAERVGVDRGVAAGALGGLSQTLNDARYGRNSQALAVLSRLGVKMLLNKDGTVNVDAMLPDIATAIARQNSSGQRTAARALGYSEAALPALTQGGKALSADMADASARGPVLNDDQIAKGERLQHRDTVAAQMLERGTNAAKEVVADGVSAAGDVVSRGMQMFSGSVSRDFVPGAKTIDRAADKMNAAVSRLAGSTPSGITSAAISAAQASERKWGIPASITLGQYQLESGAGRQMPRGSNNPFGIKARSGDPFVWAATHEVIGGVRQRVMAKFRVFNTIDEAFDAHARLLATAGAYRHARAAPTIDEYANRLQGTYATDDKYASKLKATIHSRHFTDYDGTRSPPEIPVKVDVHLHNSQRGDRVVVKAGHGNKPAISQAF